MKWQSVDYKYNIRGWLTDINQVETYMLLGQQEPPGVVYADLFSFKIMYNEIFEDTGNGSEKLYNGNIAQTFWKTGTDNEFRGYDYLYDDLNRLKKADFYVEGNSNYSGAYNETTSPTLNGGQVGDPVQLINVTKTEYMYKYNAKEWQEELGLNVYDFHARNYMPDIGRTTTQDPLAEKYYSVSPYSFFGNNPVFFVDPTGMILEPPPEFNGDSWTDDTGTYTKWEGLDNSYVKDGDTSQVYDSYDQMYYDVAKVTGIAGEAGGIVDSFINSDFWNSDLMRMIVPDVQSIGLSANVSAFLGTGSTPINVTLLTRGENPGLYFTPQVNASVGTGIEGNAGIAVSTGLYTGNPREITSSMLEGNSYGVSGGLGFKVDATAGVSYSPTGNGTGFIQGNAQIGVGIQGSPSTGVNLQANYQYTPAVTPLIKL